MDDVTAARLAAENTRLHLALAQSQDLQRLALDGWGSAWDHAVRLVGEVGQLRQELGRLQATRATLPAEHTGAWMCDHND